MSEIDDKDLDLRYTDLVVGIKVGGTTVYDRIALPPKEVKRRTFRYLDLLKLAKELHDTCSDCDGTGRIYKHADPTTGQWTPCPFAEMLDKIEWEKEL